MSKNTRRRAWDHLLTALEQRLETADTPDAKHGIYEDVIDRLSRIEVDETALTRLARTFAVDPESIAFPDSPGAMAPSADSVPSDTAPEPTVDLAAAGWAPGEPCPACGHPVVHAIVRAGMQFHADGGWEFDETLAIYEAFCSECDWLPPVVDGTRTSAPET